MDKTIITEESESYSRLKSDIKDKYTKMICAELEAIRRYVVKESSVILGDDFLEKLGESEQLKKECDQIRNEFHSREEYINAQSELTAASKAVKNRKNTGSAGGTDNTDNTEETKRLNKAISAITTLNVTLNNKLKDKNDRRTVLEKELNAIVRENETGFKTINDEVVSRVKRAVSDCIAGYADEIGKLNECFNVKSNELDLPFDEKVIRLDIPVFGRRTHNESAANDDSDDDKDGKRNFVPSDDNNGVLN
ncbi:MAG: hypothetical protein PUI31_00215 [Clostridia bacterium]|nr:hypothetical protein [Clostridia bacterium]